MRERCGNQRRRRTRKFVGWFGHQDGLKSQLTARENLSFFTQLYSGDSDVDAALRWAGLSRAADFPVQCLSAGQKKRLALARSKLQRSPAGGCSTHRRSVGCRRQKACRRFDLRALHVWRHCCCRHARNAFVGRLEIKSRTKPVTCASILLLPSLRGKEIAADLHPSRRWAPLVQAQEKNKKVHLP